ncbi:MAG TPA: SIS domain-containing protein [Chloroflexi bacterium]|jgi:glucosamine--fructose-6-phosphate aminotransferase (isomerizing)|nr:SIS domain-containing protein [Chloroflexota bacterium]
MSLRSEIFEQPEVIDRLLVGQAGVAAELAREIHRRDIRYAYFAARGTSDNAARYAQYLWGIQNGLTVALATPSLFSLYNHPPRLKDALVVGVSQSGKSPDIVSVLAEGRKQGCLTVAITNAPDSPLAAQADFVLDIQAGVEQAVAATKTYTSSLMAVAMLSQALNPQGVSMEELEKISGWMQFMLEQDELIERTAQRYRYMEQCVVLGRGYNYCTAIEWSLKMKEMTYLLAAPYSSADFQHGPIAVVAQGYPVLAVVPEGKVYADMLGLLRQLHDDKQAELLVISNQEEALRLAKSPLRLPVDMPEWASPLVSIVGGQLFAYHLTRAKGYDTEAPRGLRKVTETQ